MSFFILILVTVLVLGLLSIWWERRWKGRNNALADDQNATSPAPVTTKLAESIRSIRAKFSKREQRKALVDRFRIWSDGELATDAQVKGWLDSLSDPAYAAFVEHLAEFSDDMGFSLSDLVDGQMERLPGVASSASQIILNYCRANHQAALTQVDFDGYRMYADYLRSPTSADSQRFAKQLYSKLVEQQVVPVPTPELLDLTEYERLMQMQDAIGEATKHPDKFREVLCTVTVERQRSAADLTVAEIVQRAMDKVSQPPAEAAGEVELKGQDPLDIAKDGRDESVALSA